MSSGISPPVIAAFCGFQVAMLSKVRAFPIPAIVDRATIRRNLAPLIPHTAVAQSVDISIRKGTEQHPVHHAKHGDSCADTKSQRKNRGESKCWRFNQLAYCVTKILNQRLHVCITERPSANQY
jgi:hypothetical protein